MKKLLLAGVAAVGLTFAASGAQAAIQALSGPNNAVIGDGIKGWYGATWYLFAGASTVIDVWYLGKEAGATNTFVFNGTTFVNTSTTLIGPGPGIPTNTGKSTLFGGSTDPVLVGDSLTMPGLLDFVLTTTFGSGGSVTNAANPLPPTTPNFFSTVATCSVLDATCFGGGSYATSGNTLLLALDDGGGGQRNPDGSVNPDGNHDDLVVVIRISNGTITVPEPATLGLLGAGLVGLGLAARRRRKVA